MKRILAIFTLSLGMLSACTPKETKSEYWTINLNETYPQKDLYLQDIANIRYVPLETDSLFLIGGHSVDLVSEHYIGFSENRSGNMLFYTKDGKKAFSFNHKGNGPEDYTNIDWLILDETKSEIYLDCIMQGRFQVYSTKGQYLRTIPYRLNNKGDINFIDGVIPVGNQLLCSQSNFENYSILYLLNKEENGKSTLLDSIPKEKVVQPYIFSENENNLVSIAPGLHPLSKRADGSFVYADHSKDTLFIFSKDMERTPFIIRTPSIHSEASPKKILKYDGECEEWVFLTTVELSYDFVTKKGLKKTHYGIMKSSGKVFEINMKNRDIADADYVRLAEQGIYYSSFDLMNALEDGKISEMLSPMVEQLTDDDNGIVMLIEEK